MTERPIRMLTINEAAERVPGLTKYRIRQMCRKGELPCFRAGNKYLICEEVLLNMLTNQVPDYFADNIIEPIRRINE